MIVDFHVHMLDEHVFRASTNKTVFSGFGADRLVMGSDYPVGEKDPVGWIRAQVSSADFERICGANAARLLNLN